MIILKLLYESYTKQDIQRIFSEVYEEFNDYSEDLDFCTQAIVNPDVKWLRSNATRSLGTCRQVDTRYGGGMELPVFDIHLNPVLLEYDSEYENQIRDVIAHELCHTLPGCQNHGKEFHNKARIIGDLLGYKIDTKADADASAQFVKVRDANGAPYKVKCDNCGAEREFPKLNDQIKKSYYYKCAQCGKPYLVPYKLNKRTGEYTELDSRQMIDAIREMMGVPPL